VHDTYPLHVLAVDTLGMTITLSDGPDAAESGIFRLAWPGGHARVGPVTASGPGSVTRRLSHVSGRLAPGEPAGIEPDPYTGNPFTALGIPFTTVRVPTPLGGVPAWQITGRRSTWVMLIHGLGGSRADTLPVMPALRALSFPVLAITYRNDAGAPPGPDGLYHLGDSEWLDLEAAVLEAQTQGAREVIAFGDSMGGAIVMQFLERSPLSASVKAVVLDSPVLDWTPVLALAGEQIRLPPIVLGLAKRLACLRTGIRWDRLDQVGRAGDLAVPVLIIHGDADETVPASTSAAYAAARPDLVTYVPVPGAAHVEGWMSDQPACRAALRAFLERLV